MTVEIAPAPSSAQTPSARSRFIAIALPAAVGLVLAVFSAKIGFFIDDEGFRARLHSRSRLAPAIYDLFRFSGGSHRENIALVTHGALPWWTALDFRLHFFRPLTSMLMALDDALFADHALPYHLHSALWYVALIVLVGAVFQRVLPFISAAIATLVFVACASNFEAYAWISARHTLVGWTFGMLSLWTHLKWRQDQWRPGRWLGPIALMVGLAGSEMAIAAVGYWVAYEWVRPRGPSENTRWKGLISPIFVSTVWLGVYRALRCGASGSGAYHDPVSQPIEFVRSVIRHGPILLGDVILGVPVELSREAHGGRLWLLGLAAVIFLLVAYRLIRADLSAEYRSNMVWLTFGASCAILVACTGTLSGRVLIAGALGISATIGTIIHHAVFPGNTTRFPRRALSVAMASVLVVAHLVFAPVVAIRSILTMAARARWSHQVAADLASIVPSGARVFIASGSDPLTYFYPRGILVHTNPGAIRCWSVLSATAGEHRLMRTGPNEFSIEALQGPLLDSGFALLFRAKNKPFSIGDEVHQCGASIRVDEVSNGALMRIGVRIEPSLDAQDVALVFHDFERWHRVDMPEIGSSVIYGAH